MSSMNSKKIKNQKEENNNVLAEYPPMNDILQHEKKTLNLSPPLILEFVAKWYN